MDFKSAEVYVNISALFAFPPVMIIGKNGIGKSKMVE
jgi:predicted ATPase